MKKSLFLLFSVVLLTALLLKGRFWGGDMPAPEIIVPSEQKMRGVNWVAGDSITLEQLQDLKSHNVTWIAQTPFGWQKAFDSPEVRQSRDERVYWGERDSGVVHTTKLAKQLGIKTLLKPHIWLMERDSGKWLGDIEMQSEAEWEQWFANYSAFILHYARLAEELQIEAFCIGTELYLPAVRREQDWRKLIGQVREVYSGQLTYAANWYKEYEEIQFWDALDFIGVQAYFPLTQQQNPSTKELQKGWKAHKKQLEAKQRKYGKPIVFTEVGYKSTPDAAIEPWKWPERKQATFIPLSEKTQANAYEALFEQFWETPWFGGTFIWKWYPRLRENRRDHIDFTPQQKPAAEVMKQWYGK